MDKLLLGDIITVPGILDGTYIVLSRIEQENLIYALLTEFDGQVKDKGYLIDNVKIDMSKIFAISYNRDTEEINFEKNIDNIVKLLEEMKKIKK